MPRPTSLPVPAVVGTAAMGGRDGLDLLLTAPGQVVVGEPAGMGDQQPDRLGRIDRTSAADRHQTVAGLGPIAFQAGKHIVFSRVGRTSLKTTACLPSGPATCAVSPIGDQPGISHDQRSRYPQSRSLAGKMPASPRRQTRCGSEK